MACHLGWDKGLSVTPMINAVLNIDVKFKFVLKTFHRLVTVEGQGTHIGKQISSKKNAFF